MRIPARLSAPPGHIRGYRVVTNIHIGHTPLGYSFCKISITTVCAQGVLPMSFTHRAIGEDSQICQSVSYWSHGEFGG